MTSMGLFGAVLRCLASLLPAKTQPVGMDCQKTSLSAPPCSATPTDTRSSKTVDCYKTSTSVKPVTITVEDGHGGAVSGYLHVPAGYEARRGSKKIGAAAILLSGAWGVSSGLLPFTSLWQTSLL